MRKQNTGQIRIVEAFLAVLIIFSALAVSTSVTTTRNLTRHDNLASVGFQALLKLDSDGSLGKYIDNGNWTALRDVLNLLLPTGVSFNLTVYDSQMQQVNSESVSNGGLGSSEIASMDYVCSSRNPVFHTYVVHLLLAVVT
jgi:hypothetical protein